MPRFRQLQLPDVFLQVGDCIGLRRVLVLEHLLRLPIGIGQKLVNLNIQGDDVNLRGFNYTEVVGVHDAAGLELVESLDQLVVLLLVELKLVTVNTGKTSTIVHSLSTYLLSHVFVTFLVASEQLIPDEVLLSQHLVLFFHLEVRLESLVQNVALQLLLSSLEVIPFGLDFLQLF